MYCVSAIDTIPTVAPPALSALTPFSYLSISFSLHSAYSWHSLLICPVDLRLRGSRNSRLEELYDRSRDFRPNVPIEEV